jgi:hypothetical protein
MQLNCQHLAREDGRRSGTPVFGKCVACLSPKGAAKRSRSIARSAAMDLAGQTGGRVAQATSIIAVQVPCPRDEALQRLFIRASAMNQLMDEIALDVIDGIITFGPRVEPGNMIRDGHG